MINLTINGVTFAYPQTGDSNWGDGATGWAQAVTSGMLSKAGGSFSLTAQVDFGTNFGIKVLSILTETANPSGTGYLKLANADAIGWRNSGNSADLVLKPHADGILQYNSVDLITASATQTLSNKTLASATFSGTTTFPGTSSIDGSGNAIFGGSIKSSTGTLNLTPASSNAVIEDLLVGSNIVFKCSNATPADVNVATFNSDGTATFNSDLTVAGALKLAPSGTGILQNKTVGSTTEVQVSNASSGDVNALIISPAGVVTVPSNLIVSGTITGTASGNTTYTANNHGVVVSGSANAMSVIAPDSSTTKVLVSGGASANPAWGTVTSVFPALTGDVTTSGPGSIATTIAATSNATLATLSGLTSAASLATVGTIGTGTWAGTTIAVNHGGTGTTTSTGSGSVVLSTSPTLTTPVIASIVNTGTLTLPTASDTLVGRATTDTLTNKTISGGSNTLSSIANASLSNSSVTIGSTSVSLGATVATFAGVTLTAPTTTGTLGGASATWSGNVYTTGETGVSHVFNDTTAYTNPINSLTSSGHTFMKVSHAGTYTLNGISGGADGKLLFVINGTGNTMTVVHGSGSGSDAIATNTGGSISVINGAIASFIYDGTASVWRMYSPTA